MKSWFKRLFQARQADPHAPPKVLAGTCGNYCLSLPSQPERLEETRRQLARYGIELEHFPGVPSAEVSARISRKDGCPEGAHGALQAFINLFRHIAATHPATKGSDRPYVAVFEDDVIPLENFGEIDAYLALVPDEWDHISLGGNFHHKPPEILSDHLIRPNAAFNLHAQLIRVDFLPKLIERIEIRDFEVDVITATMQEQRIGNWYGFTSDFIWQHARTSFFCVSLWEHQLGLFHFAKGNGVVDRFLIKGLLRRP
jgi:hypothetical protein